MKVLVNDTTVLTVEDVDGNVLYEWNPLKVKTTHSKDIDSSTESIIDSIMKASRYE